MADDLTHLMAERMAQTRFAELAASAGVSSAQLAQQLLFYLPPEFIKQYEALWYKAFAGKDDGGINARGQAQAEAARVGKASGKGLQGLGGARRKTYKRYWVIADDQAVALKTRIDKRLRAIARDIADELAGITPSDAPSCTGCGRRATRQWSYCPECGEKL